MGNRRAVSQTVSAGELPYRPYLVIDPVRDPVRDPRDNDFVR